MRTSIAIIGLGCWYPGASGPLELWENVLARRQAFRRFPEGRLSLHDYQDDDPDAPDKTYVRRGAFVDGFELDRDRWRVPRSTYERFDLGFAFRGWRRVTPHARVENLGDTQYAEALGFAAPGRQFVGGLSLTF